MTIFRVVATTACLLVGMPSHANAQDNSTASVPASTAPGTYADTPLDCSEVVCSNDLCPDGFPRRHIRDTCCGCPIECSNVLCTAEACPNGQIRRAIGNDCCKCPEEAPNAALDKVVGLLTTMETRAEAALADEVAKYNTFEAWCTEAIDTKTEETATQADQIAGFNADIESLVSQLRILDTDIENLKLRLEVISEEKVNATTVRKEQSAANIALIEDYTESLDALAKATTTLQGVSANTAGLAATWQPTLLQVSQLPHLPMEAKSILNGFLQIKAHQGMSRSRAKAKDIEDEMINDVQVVDLATAGQSKSQTSTAGQSFSQTSTPQTCQETEHGCCADGQTIRQESGTNCANPAGCAASTYGCCQDGETTREDTASTGCPVTTTAPPFAHEFQSGNILEMFEALTQKFTTLKTDLQTEENHANQLYNQGIVGLDGRAGATTNTLAGKNQLKREVSSTKFAKEYYRKKVQDLYDVDIKYLRDTQMLCDLKKQEWEIRSADRNAELDAIKKCIAMLTGEEVQSRGRYQLGLRNAAKGIAFVQFNNKVNNKAREPAQDRLVDFLMDRGRHLNSQALLQMAQKAGANPFKKVKQMIRDLVNQLESEHDKEQQQESECRTSLAANKKKRELLSAKTARFQAIVEDFESQLAATEQQIVDNTKRIYDVQTEISKQDTARGAYKRRNEETIAEAQAAKEALTEGIALIKEVYGRLATRGEDEEVFLQRNSSYAYPNFTGGVQPTEPPYMKESSERKEATETWNSKYTGMQGESKGVIALMEVIMSDFSKLELETTAEEEQEQTDYDEWRHEAKKEYALLEATIRNDKVVCTRLEADIESNKGYKETAQQQLDAAEEEYEALKPICVDKGISYDERVAQREAEIAALKQAVGVLTGSSFGDTGIGP